MKIARPKMKIICTKNQQQIISISKKFYRQQKNKKGIIGEE